MRILYGVAGEGFGHSSRALAIASYLEKKGHEVVILTYGQAYKVLKKRFKVFKVRGFRLKYKRGVLNVKKTIGYNFKYFISNIFGGKRFDRLMRTFKPDLCISDMEPIVPVLRNQYKLPLICIDNQHRLTNLQLNIPKKYYQDYLLAKLTIAAFVRKADYFIVTSFARAKILKKNTLLVPPIIREGVRKLKGRYGRKILVYLNKKDRHVLNILKKIDEEFVVYGYGKSGRKENLLFKTRESFLSDLRDCKAIIATAGFTLASEAIYLNKPYLALPLKGQFEQMLNALFLKKAGFGEYTEYLTEEEVRDFLKNLEKYKRKLRAYNPDYDKLFKVLDKVLKQFNK